MQLVLRCSLWSFPALGRVQVRAEFSKLHFLSNIRYLAIICWMDIFGSSLVEDSATRDPGCWLIYFLLCVPKKYTHLHMHFKKLQKKLSFAIRNKNKLMHSFLHFVLSNRTCQHFLVRVSKSFCCNWEMLESVYWGYIPFPLNGNDLDCFTFVSPKVWGSGKHIYVKPLCFSRLFFLVFIPISRNFCGFQI